MPNYVKSSTARSRDVCSIAWSPDGRYIASGGARDSTVQVWEAFSGNTVLTYKGHMYAVTPMGWSPDGKYIASGCVDGTIHVWEAFTGKRILTYLNFAQNSGSVLPLERTLPKE